MQKPLLSKFLFLILFLAACQSLGVRNRQEIDTGSGMYTYGEGKSSYSQEYRQAIDRLAKGDFAGAEAIYRRLAELEPSQAGAYIGLGSSLLKQDRFDEAEDAYNQALLIAPKSVQAWIGLGSTAHLQADLEGALVRFSQAVELDPQNPDAHWGAAIVLRELGRETEALDHLASVIALAPGTGLADAAQQMSAEINMDQSAP
jgi:Flp pilus assembly protein TadD